MSLPPLLAYLSPYPLVFSMNAISLWLNRIFSCIAPLWVHKQRRLLQPRLGMKTNFVSQGHRRIKRNEKGYRHIFTNNIMVHISCVLHPRQMKNMHSKHLRKSSQCFCCTQLPYAPFHLEVSSQFLPRSWSWPRLYACHSSWGAVSDEWNEVKWSEESASNEDTTGTTGEHKAILIFRPVFELRFPRKAPQKWPQNLRFMLTQDHMYKVY